MSKIQKLIDKLYRRPVPNDITFEELSKIAEYYGCKISSRGKHQRAIVYVEQGRVIPIPDHGKTVGVAYIKEVKELFDSISGKNGETK